MSSSVPRDFASVNNLRFDSRKSIADSVLVISSSMLDPFRCPPYQKYRRSISCSSLSNMLLTSSRSFLTSSRHSLHCVITYLMSLSLCDFRILNSFTRASISDKLVLVLKGTSGTHVCNVLYRLTVSVIQLPTQVYKIHVSCAGQ